MPEAVIVEAVRTPIARGKQIIGELSGVHAAQLLAMSYTGLIEKAGLVPGVGGIGKTAATSAAGVAGGTGFGDLVKEAAAGALKAGQGSEVQALKAAAKDAEIVDVVTAVANAEITLETVMTVRDRVIQAYQEIMKMPI